MVGRFALIGYIWDIWFGMFGYRGLICQKILAEENLVECLGAESEKHQEPRNQVPEEGS